MEYEVKIKLEHAKKTDFVELATSHPKPEYRVRLGVPYWLINSKGIIEHNNYITNDNLTFKQLADYFARRQILTIKK
mgnify:CR=1 FL=1